MVVLPFCAQRLAADEAESEKAGTMAAEIRQATFYPGDADKPAELTLFDDDGKPVEHFVTVSGCNKAKRARSVAATGTSRKVVLPPGDGVWIEGLRDAEGRPVRLYLMAKPCPDDDPPPRNGPVNMDAGTDVSHVPDLDSTRAPEPIPTIDDLLDVVSDVEPEEFDVDEPEGLADESEG
jgi:hypothetical protein